MLTISTCKIRKTRKRCLSFSFPSNSATGTVTAWEPKWKSQVFFLNSAYISSNTLIVGNSENLWNIWDKSLWPPNNRIYLRNIFLHQKTYLTKEIYWHFFSVTIPSSGLCAFGGIMTKGSEKQQWQQALLKAPCPNWSCTFFFLKKERKKTCTGWNKCSLI